MNQLGLVQPVDGLGEGVVVAVTPAAHRRLDAGLRQSLAVASRHILRTPVAVVNERAIALRLTGIQSLLERVQNEVGAHRIAHTPPNDAAGKDVDHEGDIQPALPSRNVGEVRDPQLVRPGGAELSIDPIQRAWRVAVADRRSHNLAASHALNAQPAHQALDRTAGDAEPLTHQLAPHLVRSVYLQVCPPDPLDLRHQLRIAALPNTAERWITLARRMSAVTGWGDCSALQIGSTPNVLRWASTKPASLEPAVELRLGEIRAG